MRIGFRRLRRSVLGAVAAAAALLVTAPAFAASSAVVFMYHRFGENTLPSTNTTIAQLDAHIQTLKSGRFTVLPLPQIVAAIREKRQLPDRTVGLSVDDAFRSLYDEGWPRLRQAGLPFTLFVATDPIDRGFRNYMGWDQIRELAAAGVTIGSQTASHPHMPLLPPGKNADELARSNRRFEQELGKRPVLFAYPFGEISSAARSEVDKAGFVAAFGQHSGVLYPDADHLYLPRFAMNETYGSLDRFVLAANALPIEARDIAPADPLLTRRNNPPEFAFTVAGDARGGLGSMACYASGQGRTALERRGQGRVIVKLAEAFPPGRARINCTLPAGDGRWRWFGMQFFVPEP
ncbi:MAG: polysaccharide deacetylase family protein [Defluviicoccus sp.]|nr:polysaccharide deacetylase family protein [Defluviicoccus sp.]MDE0384138.1 polysaccharide deacetylase family protein [Defluviicoccus sp.]